MHDISIHSGIWYNCSNAQEGSKNRMQLFVVDAFTDQIFGGNQAGVVLLREEQPFPDNFLMQKIAAELKHSETAFVKKIKEGVYQLRYFTPEGEVELCGHATVSAFTVLREQGSIACGDFIAKTQSGDLRVSVEPDKIWMEMPKGELIRTLTAEEVSRTYAAYGLRESDRVENMPPAIVKVGLADILLPVRSKDALDHAIQNREAVIRLSKECGLVGVHMFFSPESGAPTAYCRNFAPLFGIDEESATGTSNASLTYYLNIHGCIQSNEVNMFVQGEAMGKPSTILSKVDERDKIWIGGNAVISVQGALNID
jgi:PhzF family phenazine biosynthesis protein